MKTINLELSKRLTEGGYLEWVETEICYIDEKDSVWDIYIKWRWIMVAPFKDRLILKNIKWEPIDNIKEQLVCKTLTLKEAIEFLPSWTRIITSILSNWNKQYSWDNTEWRFENLHFQYNTLIELIEKMLEYLLINNLLWQKQEKN